MRSQKLLSVGAALCLLAGVGAAKADEPTCTALLGRAYAAAVMSLPQAGARIAKAEWIAPGGPVRAYCKVTASIAPVDPAAPPILVAVNLPDQWNRRAVQFGGGGLNGVLVDGLSQQIHAAPSEPTPLAQGYVTLGTDGGHPAARPEIGVFFLNDEAVFNHAHGANKKAHDLALAIVADYYRAKPEKFYFVGGSEGGRQAMGVVQRYPQDYDGVVAVVPGLNVTANYLTKYNAWLASLGDGWLSPAQVALLDRESARQCDGLDGLSDGVISKYLACRKVFKFDPIRCADAAREDCLTDRQISTVETWRNRYSWGFPLANGVTGIAGWPIGGEAQAGAVTQWITLPTRHATTDPGFEINSSQFNRYYVMRDGGFRGPLPLNDPAVRARVRQFSAMADQSDTDLTRFLARGGKLIVVEHSADYALSPEANFAYFDAVRRRMGASRANQFVRLYVIPGANHGGSGLRKDGAPIPNTVDLLGELVRWQDTGTPPGPLIVTAYKEGRPTATEPLCEYPSYPRYNGAGDPDRAASFRCAPH